jgi:hypothetical protein
MPEVLELTIASARRTASTRASERLLGVEPLDDRLDDPVGAGDRRQIVVEAAVCDERLRGAVKNGSGLSARGACETFARGVARDVEQSHAHARVGEVRGDLRAHHARAQDAASWIHL